MLRFAYNFDTLCCSYLSNTTKKSVPGYASYEASTRSRRYICMDETGIDSDYGKRGAQSNYSVHIGKNIFQLIYCGLVLEIIIKYLLKKK